MASREALRKRPASLDPEARATPDAERNTDSQTFRLVDSSGTATEFTLDCTTTTIGDPVMQSCAFFPVPGEGKRGPTDRSLASDGAVAGFLLAETERCGKHHNIRLESGVAHGSVIRVTLAIATLWRSGSWPEQEADRCSSRETFRVRTIQFEYELEGGQLRQRGAFPADLKDEIAWYETEAEKSWKLWKAEEQARKAHEEEGE
jgi:hypothetical protein